MSKELFNGTLITSPNEPDDLDRVAFGQPSVQGSKNITWVRLKEILQGIVSLFNFVDFNPTATPPAHQAGRLYFDSVEDALTYYNSESDISLQIGRELWVRVKNNTGQTILNCTNVYISTADITSKLPAIGLADCCTYEKSRIIGKATHDIEDNTIGYVAFFGIVRDCDTSSFNPGDTLYLTSTGGDKNTFPVGGEYTTRIGTVLESAVNGSVQLNISTSEYTVETLQQTGWPDVANLNITFDDLTRTLTVAPLDGISVRFYEKGIKRLIEGAGDTFQIADTTGLHFVYYSNGVITETINPTLDQEASILANNPVIRTIYWRQGDRQIYMGIQTHNSISYGSRQIALDHLKGGAQYVGGSGLGLTDFTIVTNASLPAHAQFAVQSGKIVDSDILTTTPLFTSTSGVEIAYIQAGGAWQRATNAGYSFLNTGTGRVAYSNPAGGLLEAGDNTYVLYHLFANNDQTSTRRVLSVPGLAAHTSVVAAEAAADQEAATILAAAPVQEFVLVGIVIIHTRNSFTNTVKARVAPTSDGDNYIDKRSSGLVSSGGGSTPLKVFADNEFKIYDDITLNELTFVLDNLTGNRSVTWQDKSITVAGLSDLQTSLRLQFDTSTTASDPGTGKFKLNNATQGSATELYISDTEYDNGNMGDFLNALSADSLIGLKAIGNRAKWANIKVTSITNNTGWWTIVMTVENKGTDFALNDVVGVSLFGVGGDTITGTPKKIVRINDAGDGTDETSYDYDQVQLKESRVINNAVLSSDNSNVIVEFNSRIYGNSNGQDAVFHDAFELTYTDNSDTALNVEIIGATKEDNSFLIGGEKKMKFHIYVDGISDGNGVINIKPKSNRVFDFDGNAYLNTESTGDLSLNTETVDFLTRFKDVPCYIDGTDTNFIDGGDPFILTDKSNNAFSFEQAVAANAPSELTGYIQFATGDYLQTERPLVLNGTGFSLFFVINRTSGDDIICEFVDNKGMGLPTSFILIRSSTIIINGPGATISYSLGSGKKMIEFRYDGNTTWDLYVDKVFAATANAITNVPYYFIERLGSSSATQGLDGSLYNFTAFNSTDATRRAYVEDKLYNKYIAISDSNNDVRELFTPIIFGYEQAGQSNGVGRYGLDELSGDLLTNYSGDVPNTYIYPASSSLYAPQTPYNPANQNFNETSANHFSCENAILRRLREDFGSGFVIKSARGNTYLGATANVTDWDKSEGESYIFTYFTWALIQYLKSIMLNPINLAQLWMQGENDATDATLAAAYGTNYIQRKSDFRSDTLQPLLSFIFPKVMSGTYLGDVNQGVIDSIPLDSNSYYDTLSEFMDRGDGVHYDSESLIILGNNFYVKYIKPQIEFRLLIGR